jgi:chromatin assembly factor 1 subunit A
MQPPRLPLQASNQTNILLSPAQASIDAQQQSMPGGENEVSSSKLLLDQKTSRTLQKPLRLIPNELLPSFKQAVTGSDLNKVGLVEILKKKYAISPIH